MGKKTYEEIAKIILTTVIAFLLTTMATRRILIDSKLDKDEYYRDKQAHAKEHVDLENRITKHFDDRFDDFKDFMIELNKK